MRWYFRPDDERRERIAIENHRSRLALKIILAVNIATAYAVGWLYLSMDATVAANAKVTELDRHGAKPAPDPVHAGSLMAIIRRIAQADDDGHLGLHLEGLGVLVGDGLQEERELRRRSMRAFQRIGQVDVRSASGQLCSLVLKRPRDAQFRHGERTNHDLEAVEVGGKGGSLPRHGARALLALNLAQGVLDDAKKVRSRAGGGIHCDNVGVGESQCLAQAISQQFVDQPDLCSDDLNGRIICAGILPQLRIVGGKEVFVEIKPRIFRSDERRWRHFPDHADQQVHRSGDFRQSDRVRQDLQRPGKQAVLGGQSAPCTVQSQRVCPFAPSQQERECYRLSVSIGELIVAGIREQELPPLPCKLHQRRLRVLESVGHVFTQHPAQRGKQVSQALEVDLMPAACREPCGNNGPPGQEVGQKAQDSLSVVGSDSVFPIRRHVARQPDNRPDRLPITVQAPIVAVAVDQVRYCGKPPGLFLIMADKPVWVRPGAGRFQLDIAYQQLRFVHRIVRLAQAAGQLHLAGADHVQHQRLRDFVHECFKRPAKLVFRLTCGHRRHLGRDRIGELLQSGDYVGHGE